MKQLGLAKGLEGKRIIVQGLGNVGYYAAKFCLEGGAILVGLVEYDGAIYNPKGLDLEAVVQHRKEKGTILDFPGATNIAKRELGLEQECDILIPAALENQITEQNAGKIKAKMIAEGANGPTTAAADAILRERKVMVIPDMYLNAGGVTVSYFEWLKNLSHVRFGRMGKRFEQTAFEKMLRAVETATGKAFTDVERNSIAHGADEIDLVNSGLEETMINAYNEIRSVWKGNAKIPDLRTAAYIDAINKIAVSYLELGIFP
jgi:glutamate dehydrogenase (NAD(P)+)